VGIFNNRFIDKENRYQSFDFQDLEEIYQHAVNKVKTGLLLHHFAILYLHNGKLNKCNGYFRPIRQQKYARLNHIDLLKIPRENGKYLDLK
jgi:hypothetical protein